MFQNILLAYDGSDQTEIALRKAGKLAKLCNAQLHVLGVGMATGTVAILQVDAPYDLLRMAKAEVETKLAKAVAKLDEYGLEVTTHVRTGDPADEIIAQALESNADLVVMGHEKRGFFGKWLIGSTGAEILHNLPCNLLIATSD